MPRELVLHLLEGSVQREFHAHWSRRVVDRTSFHTWLLRDSTNPPNVRNHYLEGVRAPGIRVFRRRFLWSIRNQYPPYTNQSPWSWYDRPCRVGGFLTSSHCNIKLNKVISKIYINMYRLQAYPHIHAYSTFSMTFKQSNEVVSPWKGPNGTQIYSTFNLVSIRSSQIPYFRVLFAKIIWTCRL